MVIYYHVGSTNLEIISLTSIDPDMQILLFVGIFISMSIKTPTLPWTTWLVNAHTYSNVGGSIVLAGLILKLATYGFLRIMLPILPEACVYFAPVIQTIAVITLVYASLSTMRQTDFKKVVAYSSVGHMAVTLLGIFSNTIQGIEGAIIMSVAHGVVSPALFFLVGSCLYDRFHTRVIKYYRGMTNYMPVFSLFFFLFTIFNAAVPLSANWTGEFMMLAGIFKLSPIIGALGSLGIVLSAAYSIWMFNRIAFGGYSLYLNYTNDLTRREVFLLIPLLVVAVVIGILPNIMLENIHLSVSTLIYPEG